MSGTTDRSFSGGQLANSQPVSSQPISSQPVNSQPASGQPAQQIADGSLHRVMVTGVRGQLGHDVVADLKRRKIDCQGVDIQDFDLTDAQAVSAAVQAYRPSAIVHCAAWTAVDKAEDEAAVCRRINVDGTANLALACREVGAELMYISTDYVFPGDGEKPWEVDDPVGPRSVYGLTKWQGEETVRQLLERWFIVRTAWVFGVNGNNFVKTMLRLGTERESIRVVDDQFGSPTYTADLAPLLCDILNSSRYGTYHATNEGFCSWFDFATAIILEADLDCRVNRIPSSAYPTRAVRPLNSRLSKSSLDEGGFRRLPAWRDALQRYLRVLAKEGAAFDG